MADLTITNVNKFYDKTQVLFDVNLDIKDGEFIVLVGPSGCGKSTLLRMIAGLEDINSGEISLGGKVINQLAPRDRDVSMVFQNYALYPHLSVAKNIGFSLRMRKVEKSIITPEKPVAELIVGSMINLLRKINSHDQNMKKNIWKKEMGNLLYGKNSSGKSTIIQSLRLLKQSLLVRGSPSLFLSNIPSLTFGYSSSNFLDIVKPNTLSPKNSNFS